MSEGNSIVYSFNILHCLAHSRVPYLFCLFKYTNDMLEGNLLFIHSGIQRTIVYSFNILYCLFIQVYSIELFIQGHTPLFIHSTVYKVDVRE